MVDECNELFFIPKTAIFPQIFSLADASMGKVKPRSGMMQPVDIVMSNVHRQTAIRQIRQSSQDIW